jgi:hypothetical protein
LTRADGLVTDVGQKRDPLLPLTQGRFDLADEPVQVFDEALHHHLQPRIGTVCEAPDDCCGRGVHGEICGHHQPSTVRNW